jgi:hypothetical protein
LIDALRLSGAISNRPIRQRFDWYDLEKRKIPAKTDNRVNGVDLRKKSRVARGSPTVVAIATISRLWKLQNARRCSESLQFTAGDG